MNAMIHSYVSTFSGNFSAAILLWPLLSLLLSLPILIYLYRRDGWLPLSAVFVTYLCVLYMAGLVCFTLYPLPSGDAGPGITYGIPPILNPLNFVDDIASAGASAVFQLVFNIVLFVPLGFFAKTVLRLGFAPTLGISFAATCLIETAQLTGLFGAYPFAFRTFDVDDLICNTLGGLVGWVLGWLASRLAMRDAAAPPPVTHDPGFVRRCVAFLTDAMIVDVCIVVPRMVVVVGLQLLFGGISIPLDAINQVMTAVLFIIAFAVVEVVVPWRCAGSTPAGMFYRMSCETRKRSGQRRVAFYALRALVLAALMLFLRYVALPLAVFYLVARKMPYDFVPADVPAEEDASVGERPRSGAPA